MKGYRKNHLFVARKVGDHGFLVPVSEKICEMQRVYRLNRLGWFVWHNLGKKRDLASLASLVSKEYGVDEATAVGDITIFLDDLRGTGALLLEEETQGG